MLVVFAASGGASERVRTERGRFWIECSNASLEEILREIAAVAPMELWLDEGLRDQKVSVSLSGVTMKEAVQTLFEDVKVNYVLYLDSASPERVDKVYVGGSGAGRLGREPTIPSEPAGSPPQEPVQGNVERVDDSELPPDVDPDELLQSPDARKMLGELKNLLKQQNAADENDSPRAEGADGAEESDGADPVRERR